MSQTRQKARTRRKRTSFLKALAERIHLTNTRRRTWANNAFIRNATALGEAQATRAGQDKAARSDLLNRMTNWQRNMCLRECKGDPSSMTVRRMAEWINTPHYMKYKSKGFLCHPAFKHPMEPLAADFADVPEIVARNTLPAV